MRPIIFISIFFFSIQCFAQNVSINDTGAIPDASAMLDVQSTNKGLLIPRMSTIQRNQINPVAEGLLVYDIDTQSFWFYDANIWIELVTAKPGNVDDNDADPTNEIQTLKDVLGQGKDANSSTITNLSDPVGSQDAATKNYVDSHLNPLNLSQQLGIPMIVGQNSIANTPITVVVKDSYAYIANAEVGDAKLEVVDISNPSTPTLVGELAIGIDPLSMAMQGSHVFVANNGGNTLEVINISNPGSPTLEGEVTVGGDPRSVTVQGNYAYIANSSGGIQVVNISNPSMPIVEGNFALSNIPWSIAVKGNYIFIGNTGNKKLEVFDFSNPSTLVHVGDLFLGGDPRSIVIQGSYVYSGSTVNNKLQIINISNPITPVLEGEFLLGSNPKAIAVEGKYAYITSSSAHKLTVIDISNPASPIFVTELPIGSNPRSIAVQEEYAYVANIGNTELEVIDLGFMTQVEISGTVTASNYLGDSAVLTEMTINSSNPHNALRIIQEASVGNSRSVDGALFIDNTLNDSTAFRVYTNNSDPGGALVQLHAVNPNFNKEMFRINSAGTTGANADIRIDSPNPDIELVESDQTSPAGKFEIDVNNDQLRINGRNAADNSFETSVIIERLANGGKVGIGRPPMDNRLEVNGEASKTSAGNWIANSDARLKKNILALDSKIILEKLLRLQGIQYEWNDTLTGLNRPDGTQFGFTAQNIQLVFPKLVKEDKQGFLQTAYGTYDAMVVESIRALNDKIEQLERKNDQLVWDVKEMQQESSFLKYLVCGLLFIVGWFFVIKKKRGKIFHYPGWYLKEKKIGGYPDKSFFLLLLFSTCFYNQKSYAQFQIHSGAYVNVNGNAQITLNQINFENNGSFISGGGTVKLEETNGTFTSTVGGSSTTNFNHLTIDRTSQQVQLTTDIRVTGNINFNSGFLDLNGYNCDLGTTGSIVGENPNARFTSTLGGVVIRETDLMEPSAANPGNIGVEITTSKNLGNTIIRRGHLPKVTPTGNDFKRYYEISPTHNNDLNAFLRMYYFDEENSSLNESEMELWRFSTAGWEQQDADNRNNTNNFVEKSGIQAFSIWTLSGSDIVDNDGDGYSILEGDCDDANPSNPIDTTLNGMPIVENQYQVSNAIFSGGTIDASSIVLFKAGHQINLQQGFHALPGSHFTALIESCGIPSDRNNNSINNEEIPFFEKRKFLSNNKLLTKSLNLDNSSIERNILFSAYPNPFGQQLTLSFQLDTEEPFYLFLYNSVGKLVKRLYQMKYQKNGNYIISFQTSDLPASVYLIQLKTKEQVLTKKVIKLL